MDDIEIHIRRTSLDRITVTTTYRAGDIRMLRSYNVVNGQECIEVYMKKLAERLHRATVSVVKLEALEKPLPLQW